MMYLFRLLGATFLAQGVLSILISTCSPFKENHWQCPPFPLLEASTLNNMFAQCVSVVRSDSYVAQICSRYKTLANAAAREGCEMYQHLDSIVDFHILEFAANRTEFRPSSDVMRNMLVLVQLLQLGIATQSAREGMSSQELIGEATACYSSISAYNRETFSQEVTTNVRQISTDPINLKSARFMSAQLDYLLEKSLKQELHVWQNSERIELRSHEALTEHLKTLKASMTDFLAIHMEPAFQYFPDYSVILGDNEALALLTPYHYNRAVYMRPFPTISPHSRVLNPLPTVFFPRDLRLEGVSAAGTLSNVDRLYREQRVVVLDNFLDGAVIEELYNWALESSIWHVTEKHRYVGSYWNDGFAHPHLLQIARELQATYPFLANLSLTQMWAYNYHYEEVNGITLHADASIVNVNLWVTVDDANLDPESGGLVVYTKPLTGAETFQQVQDPVFGYEYLSDTRSQNYTIPYRQNRVTIFNSNLYHETDKLSFKKEFSKRRINFTFLFGEGKYAASA